MDDIRLSSGLDAQNMVTLRKRHARNRSIFHTDQSVTSENMAKISINEADIKRRHSLPKPNLTKLTAFIASVNTNYFEDNLDETNEENQNDDNEMLSKQDRDRLVRTKVKLFELVMCLLYALNLFYLINNDYTEGDYKFQDTIKKLFQPSTKTTISDVLDTAAFWKYMNETLLDVIYSNNNLENSDKHVRYIYPGNIILGNPILTQRRVKNNSCQVNAFFRQNFTKCYGVLPTFLKSIYMSITGDEVEEKGRIEPLNDTNVRDYEGWFYKNTDETECSHTLMHLLLGTSLDVHG
jgi:hypothetical protein